MRVTRNVSLLVQYFLDEWVPPRIRDSRLFMTLPLRLVLKDAAPEFMSFKTRVFGYSAEEFERLYQRTAHVQSLQGETDLNRRCVDRLVAEVRDMDVLEVGCGHGYLAGRLAEKNQVTACDISVGEDVRSRHPSVSFLDANVEKLPFDDNQFEAVVSTHTLEHVQDLGLAIAELRRVAAKHIYVVVPRQRPYKYTFSLHTQFFPYEWSLRSGFGYREGVVIERLGDWFYHEPVLSPASD